MCAVVEFFFAIIILLTTREKEKYYYVHIDIKAQQKKSYNKTNGWEIRFSYIEKKKKIFFW